MTFRGKKTCFKKPRASFLFPFKFQFVFIQSEVVTQNKSVSFSEQAGEKAMVYLVPAIRRIFLSNSIISQLIRIDTEVNNIPIFLGTM